MTEALRIADDVAEAEILPGRGAALASYGLLADRQPLFAPSRFGAGPEDPATAAIVLAPWSNRIGGGGFTHDGRFVSLPANLEGEPCPIHGNGFQLPWAVEEAKSASARLRLLSDGPGEFRYEADLGYHLEGGALTVELAVTSRAESPLPFGLGFHPWLPRTPATRLQFVAEAVWLEDDRHLPAAEAPAAVTSEWDFSRGGHLPQGWINNGFAGWPGTARVEWPERALALDIAASPNLTTAIVYSPDAEADFFCFEPVSHPVDAHNLPGRPGLVVLAPGGRLEASCCFTPARLGRRAVALTSERKSIRSRRNRKDAP